MHTTILLYDNLSTKSCMASLHGFTLAFIYFCLHIQALQPNVGDNSKKNDSKRNIRNVAMSRVKIQIRKKLMKSPSFFIFLQIPTFLTMFFYTSPCGHQMQTTILWDVTLTHAVDRYKIKAFRYKLYQTFSQTG